MSDLQVKVGLNDLSKLASKYPSIASRLIGHVATKIQAEGQRRTPVGPTGNLKNNVTNTYAPGALKARVVWNMEYAAYVHEGTYKMAGRPFARDAANDVMPKANAAAIDIFKEFKV